MKKIHVQLLFLAVCLSMQAAVAQTTLGNGTRNVTVENCVNTSAPESGAVAVFPNPAADFFTVKTSGEAGYFELFDLLGRKILEASLGAETATRFNTQSVPAGIYLAVWRSETSRKTSFTRLKIHSY